MSLDTFKFNWHLRRPLRLHAMVAFLMPVLLICGCDDKKKSSSGDGGEAIASEVVAGSQPGEVYDSGAGRTVSSILLPASLQNLPAKTSNASALNVRVVGNGIQYFSFVVLNNTDSCDGAAYSDPVGPDTVISNDLGSDGQKVLCVLATGTDGSGRLQIAPFQYTWTKDTTAPAVSLQAPVGFGPYIDANTSFTFKINASDSGTGLYRVLASVKNASNSCLNAAISAFDSPCPAMLPLTLSNGVYTVSILKSLLVAGTAYEVSLQAEDHSQNVNTVNAAWSGIWDTTPPATPSSMTAVAGQRLVNLSWTSAAEASSYLVLRRANGLINYVPVSGTNYAEGAALDNGQVVVGVFATTTALASGLIAFTNYNFKVFAIDAAGNIQTTGATSTAQPDDIKEFRGLTHAFVWGPGRRVGAEWQPFSDTQTTYAQMNYGMFIANSANAQNFNLSPLATVNNTTSMRYTDTSADESLFVAVRSARQDLTQDSNSKDLRLRFGPGYHNKLGTSGRALATDPLSQTYIKTAQTVKLDPWGNVLFSSGAGIVNVLCREYTFAYYCKGRSSDRVYTIIGRDGMEDGEDESLASSTPIGDVLSIAVGPSGNVYIADGTYFRIRAICYNPLASGFCNGKKQAFMYRFSGTGIAADGANDTQTSSSGIGFVYGLDSDTAGNLIVGDSTYFKVRISCGNSQGLCTGKTVGNSYTLIGTGVIGDAADGATALSSAIGGPRGLKVSNTNNIYMSDFDYRRVRILCTSVSGSGEFCSGKTAGNLYRAMGTGVSLDDANDIPALSAGMGQSYEVAISDANNLFISDSTYRRIRVICYNNAAAGACSGRTIGNVYWVAGTGVTGDGLNNSLSLATNLGDIRGLTVSGDGNIVVADSTYRRLRLVCTNAAAGSLCDGKSEDYHYLLAGSGSSALGWQLPALTTPLGTTAGSAVDSLGNIWFADSTTPSVRVLCYATNSGGYCQGKTIGTAYISAGTGVAGDGADGLAISSAMGVPVGIAVNAAGNVFVADSSYRRIRAICFNTAASGFCNGKSYGNSYRFVGNGAAGDAANNVAAASAIGIPAGVELDSSGNLYIADNQYWRVRAVCQTTTGYCSGLTIGNLYNVAGTGAAADGTSATTFATAGLGAPVAIAVDSWNNIFVSDGTYFRLRAYCVNTAGGYCSGLTSGRMYRVTGGAGVAGDATNASVASATAHGTPYGMAFDSEGNIYMADASYRRIRVVCVGNSIAGPCNSQTIGNSYRVYGNGLAVGDPPSGLHGSSIRLDTPARDAIAFDLSGNLIYTGSAGSIRMFNGY